jgi:transcriptional regulator with XRE-family HTH domain
MIINGKEFLTVRDMAERLGKRPGTVKPLLRNASKRPISKDALYHIEAFDAIKDAPPPGRPKKKSII